MKKPFIIAMIICFLAAIGISPRLSGADGKKKKKRSDSGVIIFNDEVITIPEVHIDPEEWQRNMEELRREFEDMRVQLPRAELDKLRSELEKLRDLPELQFHIPDIDIDLPEIALAPIPPIHVEIPEIHREGAECYRDFPGSPFDDLSEDEALRLQALRSLVRAEGVPEGKEAATIVPALEKILQEDPSPAVRYQAVQYLARFLNQDERVVPLLGRVIREDSNLRVRKKAIRILGQSKDPRAVEILQEIARGR